jgi:1-deoxy-D-xylulose-5-phosphate reductoisomerase
VALSAENRKPEAGGKKRVCVLGSTGSIGVQALDVMRGIDCRAAGLAAGRNEKLLMEQVDAFKPLRYCHNDNDETLRLAAMEEADAVINAIGGVAGIAASFAAVNVGKPLLLANKETAVAAGAALTALAEERGVPIVPVDSEHSAIFQCLNASREPKAVEKLILTASGGPFKNERDLSAVTPARALNHPTWKMGRKVTVDSATLMNKGFELIEARWLFGVKPENIEVVIHPQSVIHSMVQFDDGAVLAQLSAPDMRLPIQYALTFPERAPSRFERLDFARLKALTFEPVDEARFPCLGIARDALAAGGCYPAVMAGADEAAVKLFLGGKIGFARIPALIERALAAYNDKNETGAPAALSAVEWGERFVTERA